MAVVVSAVELTKRFGDVTAVSHLSIRGRARQRHGLPRPERRRQDDDAAHAARPRRATHGHALVFGRRYAQLSRRRPRVGAMSRPPTSPGPHGERPPEDRCRATAGLARRPGRGGAGAGRAGRRGGSPDQGFLARDAAAPGLAAALLGDPRYSSSTSPPTGSTRRASDGCGTSCAPSPTEGRTVFVSSHHLSEIAQTVDGSSSSPGPAGRRRAAERAHADEPLAQGRLPRAHRGAEGMSDKLRSELLELRTTRALALLLLAAGGREACSASRSRRSRAISAGSRRRRRSANCSARA